MDPNGSFTKRMDPESAYSELTFIVGLWASNLPFRSEQSRPVILNMHEL